MKVYRCILICAMIAVSTSGFRAAHAQDTASRFRKQHIRGTEALLIDALKTKPPVTQRGILQHIRFLEWAYPDEEFGSFVEPLATLLKDEKADLQARMLAALALEALHSAAGDAAIKEVAGGTVDSGLQQLCAALIVEPIDGR